jgi:hypothetical protein
MLSHNLWKFVHILLFVYWLGADLGVLILARAARRSDLSFAERSFALRMAMLIDLTPRLAFAAMLPVSLELASASGWLPVVPALVRIGVWGVALAWIVLMLAMLRNAGRPIATHLGRVNAWLHWVLAAVGLGLGLTAITGHGPLPDGWLGWKVLLLGCIFICGIGIDHAFRPIVPAFGRLATEGSKPDIERSITSAVDGAIRWVLVLYVLLVTMAFLGTVKPI